MKNVWIIIGTANNGCKYEWSESTWIVAVYESEEAAELHWELLRK